MAEVDTTMESAATSLVSPPPITTSEFIKASFFPIYATLSGGVSSLLTIGTTRILLDCGWDSNFEEKDVLPALKALLSNGPLDCVLISQPDLAHCGALPILVGKLGSTAPIYMTKPTNTLGQYMLYDAFFSRNQGTTVSPSFDPSGFASLINDPPAISSKNSSFSLDDVHAAFQVSTFGGPCNLLRYLEEASLVYAVGGAKTGVAVSASNSGFLLGGSIWRISMGTETIVYAPVFNHRVERHLSRSELLNLFKSPSALITDALSGLELLKTTSSSSLSSSSSSSNPLSSPSISGISNADKPDAQIIKELSSVCLSTLRGGGNVLIPTDSTGRVLEILLRLNQSLSHSICKFPIFYLSSVAPKVLENTNTLLEYMSDRVVREFQENNDKGGRQLPFEFKPTASNIRTATSIEEVLSVAATSAVVVVTSLSGLEYGYSRSLFKIWAGNPKNAILLTSRYTGDAEKSITGQLLKALEQSVSQSSVSTHSHSHHLPPLQSVGGVAGLRVSLENFVDVPLSAVELKRHREAKEEEVRKRAFAEATERARVEEADALANTSAASSSSIKTVEELSSSKDISVESGVPTVATAVRAIQPDDASSSSSSGSAMIDTSVDGRTSTVASSAPPVAVEEEEDDPFCDDEEVVMQLDYLDEAFSSTSNRQQLVKREKGRLTSRFSMFGKDETGSSGFRFAQEKAALRASAAAAQNSSSSSSSAVFKSELTAYGETVNPLDFLETEESKLSSSGALHGQMLAINLGLPLSVQQKLQAQQQAEQLKAQQQTEVVPTKRVRQTVNLTLPCRVFFVSIQGRSDALSVLNTLESVAPLKIVLLHGAEDGAALIQASASKFCSSVSQPVLGFNGWVPIDLSSNTAQIKIRASGPFFASLGLQKVGAHEVAFVECELAVSAYTGGGGGGGVQGLVDGLVLSRSTREGLKRDNVSSEGGGLAKKAKSVTLPMDIVIEKGGEGGQEKSTVINNNRHQNNQVSVKIDDQIDNDDDEDEGSGGELSSDRSRAPVLLRTGAIRLAEVRKMLKAAGVETQLVDGAVVSQGGIIVRREKTANTGFGLEMDGPVCFEYFVVRRALYSLYTLC
jgi:Cft2 family RNA processing exonuclease